MSIDFTCPCGKHLHAPDNAHGRSARCPNCQRLLTVPLSADELELEGASLLSGSRPPPRSTGITSFASASQPHLAPTYGAGRGFQLRRYAYLLLVLTLIPLILSTFLPHEDHSDELAQALRDHPDILAQAINGDISESELKQALIDTLPGHHVTGALLSYESHAQWVIAAVAAGAYFLLLLLLFPHTRRYTKGLLFAGLFTGTAGVILLLVFQWAAFSMPLIIPRGIVGLVLLIVKLIGLSYRLADDPEKGLALSFLGYTCGVGLCEEITKAIPMLLRIKPTPGKSDATWNSLLLWGLASGIGFGIAESIMYSGRYYNGLEGSAMYWTRFVSCVALHAMWAGAVGISLYRGQANLRDTANNWEYMFRVVLIIIVPMTLHGLYDTLLKKDHDALAPLVALATFAWLTFQIERQQRAEPITA